MRGMPAGLKPYPAYKPSGVPWLGDVPAHWEVRRLKRICRLAYGDAMPAELRTAGTVPVYGSNGRVGLHTRSNTTGPCLIVGRKGSFGKVRYSPEPVFAIDTTFFVDSRQTPANVRWLYYLPGCLHLDAVSKDTAVPGLNREDAYHQFGVHPPLAEQAAIARYLDQMDGRIRRYVRAKQKLIGLLAEQRQAVIHHAVTRGLEPNVCLKPSVVAWLGEVPAHWEVRRLKQAAQVNPSRSEARGALTPDTPVTFLPMERVGTTGEVAGEQVAASAVWNGFTYFRRDDVLVAKITPCFEHGKGACLDALPTEFGFGSTEFHVLRATSLLSPQFLYRLTTLGDLRHLGTQSMIGAAGQQRVPKTFLANYPIPLPPLAEQTAIVAHLAKATAAIDTVLAATRREVELLDEYRARLIADVVTGKCDVQGVAVED